MGDIGSAYEFLKRLKREKTFIIVLLFGLLSLPSARAESTWLVDVDDEMVFLHTISHEDFDDIVVQYTMTVKSVTIEGSVLSNANSFFGAETTGNEGLELEIANTFLEGTGVTNYAYYRVFAWSDGWYATSSSEELPSGYFTHMRGAVKPNVVSRPFILSSAALDDIQNSLDVLLNEICRIHHYSNLQSSSDDEGMYTCSYEYTFEETTHTRTQITEYDERGVLKYYKLETDDGDWGNTYEITGPSYTGSGSDGIPSYPISYFLSISALGIVFVLIAKKAQP